MGMMALVIKALAGMIFAVIGLRFWRIANEWNENGEVPKGFIEDVDPKPLLKGERGFQAAISWQRFTSVLIFMFAGLFALSIILQLMGLV